MGEVFNTLYSVGRLPELPELAKRLEAEIGWKPVYWITQPELETAVKALFPDAYCHDFTDANRATGDPLDRSELPVIGHHAPSALDWTQLLQALSRHVLGRVLSTDQQIAILNERLDYCLRVVSALKIRRFVIASTPHALIDMCFYVAVRMLGGEARMQHLTGFRGLQVVLDNASAAPLGIGTPDRSAAPELSPDGSQALARMQDFDADQTPWYVRKQDEKTQAQTRLYEAADTLLKAGQIEPGTVSFTTPPLLTETQTAVQQKARQGMFRRRSAPKTEQVTVQRDVFKRTFQPKHDMAMRRAFIHKPEGFAAPAITWREYYTYRDWALIQKRALQHKYETLTEDFDIDAATAAPFVVFALHYQPERTTMPEGGWFSDQLLAVRMISEALPEGWRLLVKEHPSQFLWQTEGELARDTGYYDRLAALPGVTLVPLELNAAALLTDARAVVTITGTIGWEAALRGIPAVTLARTWYEAPGVTLPAHCAQSLAKALRQIETGWKPTQQAIRAHLACIEQIGERCFINPSHAPLYEDLTPQSNLESLCRLFVKTEKMKHDPA